MKASLVITVLNEEKTIDLLLKSVFAQTVKPGEIIIVDGGSRDGTVAQIKNEELRIKNKGIQLKIIIKKGNRAVGRNEGIRRASGDIILSADAGCVLDKNWIRNITTPFKNAEVEVVAGYYQGLPQNIFQKCLIPYVLVMSDRVDPKTFLPASRSMAFRKSVWKKLGGFPEEFLHNEDYVFAKKLQMTGTKIVFMKNAIVYWIPRENLGEAFIMFFRFAKGDMEAKIIRPKIVFLFCRYIVACMLLSVVFVTNSGFWLLATGFLLLLYFVWSIGKNYPYVKDIRAFIVLPVIQLTADIAVMLGSISGFLKRK